MLDVRSGRIIGSWGVYIMDGAAVLLLALAVTGYGAGPDASGVEKGFQGSQKQKPAIYAGFCPKPELNQPVLEAQDEVNQGRDISVRYARGVRRHGNATGDVSPVAFAASLDLADQ